ncbi:hypothetical protein D3C78_1244220 [compost metagenome]
MPSTGPHHQHIAVHTPLPQVMPEHARKGAQRLAARYRGYRRDQWCLLVIQVGDQLAQKLVAHQRPEQRTAAWTTKAQECRIVLDLEQLRKARPHH